MFGWLRRRRRMLRAAELMPTAAEFDAIVSASPCLSRLDRPARDRLRQLSAEILASKGFHGAGGFQPQRADCLPVAVHAALPVLNLGLEACRQFHNFILYTDAFEADVEEVDEAGVVHRGRDLRAGEAWHRGPVVLSLADVAESGRGDGYHVVVHEIAHQLDQLNGEADGYPPLPETIRHRDWVETFSSAWQRLNDDLAAGKTPWIDEYAAESPGEFFAVASEYFFDLPDALRSAEPGVYRLLGAFYRQDPAAD